MLVDSLLQYQYKELDFETLPDIQVIQHCHSHQSSGVDSLTSVYQITPNTYTLHTQKLKYKHTNGNTKKEKYKYTDTHQHSFGAHSLTSIYQITPNTFTLHTQILKYKHTNGNTKKRNRNTQIQIPISSLLVLTPWPVFTHQIR